MKYFIFVLIYFALPHMNWIPKKIGVQPESIPLGLVNLLLIAALVLWVSAKIQGTSRVNTIQVFTVFIISSLFSCAIGIVSGLEPTITTITIIKRQMSLMLLYYVPLAIIEDEVGFNKTMVATLVINTMIGFEVLRSGVLGGTSFHDGKRGSGPFSEGLQGSDIAASYLAQMMMFAVAILFCPNVSKKHKFFALMACIIMLLGIFATYSRGALLACAVGLVTILLILGLRFKYFVVLLMLLSMSMIIMPDSVVTRFDDTVSEGGSYDESTQGRFKYWDSAFEIALENPLGVGTGQVRKAMQEKIGKYVDPHNGFLYTLCEMGIAGMIIFLWLLVRFFLASKTIWQNSDAPLIYRIYALGMGGMVGSLVACNMFYSNFHKEIMLGTLMLHFGLLAFIVSDTSNVIEKGRQA